MKSKIQGNREIERKFLLSSVPDGCQKSVSIRQGYLAKEKEREIRIRQKGKQYYQTVKTGESSFDREELSIKLSRNQFHTLWQGVGELYLVKERYKYLWKGLTVEVDEYSGLHEGLVTGEVEFPDVSAARKFIPPAFMEMEISWDARYRNINLAGITRKSLHKLTYTAMRRCVVGTIPFFFDKNDLKLVMITNRSKTQWIFPKGQEESDLSRAAVALMEADEEAGIKGTVIGTPVIVPYQKGRIILNMIAYPLQVSELKKKWDEKNERERRVVSLKEAYKLSRQPAVLSCLKYIELMHLK